MNRKYIILVILLLFSQAAKPMQNVETLVRKGARIAGGLMLLGKGIDIAMASRSYLKTGFEQHEDFESNGCNFRYATRSNEKLGVIAAKGCSNITVGAAMFSAGMLSTYTGALLLRSQCNVASISQAARLSCCLPLFTAGVAMWHSAVGFVIETLYANDDHRRGVAMAFAGLFGVASIECFRNCFRLFNSNK